MINKNKVYKYHQNHQIHSLYYRKKGTSRRSPPPPNDIYIYVHMLIYLAHKRDDQNFAFQLTIYIHLLK